MKRLNALLRRQPWAFLVYGLAFGGSMYLARWLPVAGGRDIGVGPPVVGGLVFASLMSARLAIRESRQRITSAGPFRSRSHG